MADGTNSYAYITFPKLLIAVSSPNTPVATTSKVDLTFPSLQVNIASDSIVFPKINIGITSLNGTVSKVNARLPALLISADGVSQASRINVNFPSLILSVESVNGTASTLSKPIGKMGVSISSVNGSVGTVNFTLPKLELSIAGAVPTFSTVSITMPMLGISVSGGSDVSTTYTTLAMNSNTAALTSYDNFPFNSMTTFNGVTLAAGDNGIYALGGTLDEATQIISTVRLGIFDFGSDKLKRVDSCYFAYRSDGDLTVRVTLDDDTQYEYTLESTGQAGIYTNRLKLGKGCQGRYFQAEIESVGNPFVLDSVDLKAQELSRRI